MAKAYMTSLPNTTDTQRNFIKTVDTPKVPAMDYRSGFKDVGAAIDDTNKFLGEFSQMKYEGFQADLDRLELEHLHEMQDATDPCELEEINEKWQKNYNTALKDDFWAKSYYKSSFYKKWQDRNHEAQQKIYYAKQHEFAEICATSTLNKMAETASMLDNPADVQQYLVNGEAMLANTKHLTAEAKYRLMANFYKDTVSRLYHSDPNKAVAFLDSVGNKYDAYGVSSEEFRSKAEQYNKARERERRADIARAKREAREAKAEAREEAQNLAASTALSYKMGDSSAEDVKEVAIQLDKQGYSKAALSLYTKAFPESKLESDKQKAIERLGNEANRIADMDEGEEKEAAKLSFQEDIKKTGNTVLISDTMMKRWKDSITSAEKPSLDMVISHAKNGELTGADRNYLDEQVATGNIKTSQRDSVVSMNERNIELPKYKDMIINREITQPKQIDELKLDKDNTVKLKEYLKSYRKELGFDVNPDKEEAYDLLDKGDYDGMIKARAKLPATDRKTLDEALVKKISADQIKNYETLATQIPSRQLTQPVLDKLFEERQINPTQYKELTDRLQNQAILDVRNNVGNIAQDILNGSIKTIEQLNNRYSDVDENTPYYMTNYKALTDLLNKNTEKYRDILKQGYSIIDGMMKKDALGNFTTVSVQRAAEAKKELLYNFNQQLEDKNITVQKMGELLSPQNVGVLAIGYQVTVNDLKNEYTVGVDMDRENIVNVFRNMTADNITQLKKEDFIKEQEETPEIKETEKKNTTSLDKIKDWWDNLWKEENESEEEDGLMSSPIKGKSLEELENDENIEWELN